MSNKWIITFDNGMNLVATVDEQVKKDFLTSLKSTNNIFEFITEKDEPFQLNTDKIMSCIFYNGVEVDKKNSKKIRLFHNNNGVTHPVSYNILNEDTITTHDGDNNFIIKTQVNEDVYVFINMNKVMYITEDNN